MAASTPAPVPSAPRVGMGHRGAGLRRPGAPLPPELLSIGVVEAARPAPSEPAPPVGKIAEENGAAPARKRRGGRGRGKTEKATAGVAATESKLELSEAPPTPKAKRSAPAKKTAGRARAKKTAKKET